MSLGIGRFLNNFSGDGQISNLTVAPQTIQTEPQPTTEEYEGGSLPVKVLKTDSQAQFVWRGLFKHAFAAGLDKTRAKEFADRWTTNDSTFNHRADGINQPYTPAEFAALKIKGATTFHLNKEFDREILTDLNRRVAEITVPDDSGAVISVNTTIKLTAKQRAANEKARVEAERNKAAIAEKPVLTMIDARTKDGTKLTADLALTRYIQKTYNSDGRVWGDKINELVSLAKTRGVTVEIQSNEDGTALISVSAADKQKLDALFAETLGETIKGEQAGIKGQQEATNQVGDIGRMYVNGAINTVNHLTEPIRGTLAAAGVDTSGAKIPKLEYQSEMGKKAGSAGETGAEIGLAITTAPQLLATKTGKFIFGVSGAYQMGVGAAGVDPTEKDANGNAREMSPLERGLRIAGGFGEVIGARPNFGANAVKTGTTLSQTDEVIEAVTPNGQTVRVQAPKQAQTATGAATAKPVQTADDLLSEMRGRGGYESNEAVTRGGTRMPKVKQPLEVSPSMKPNETSRPLGTAERIPTKADTELARGLTRQNEAAETLAKNGYRVEQKPELSNTERMSNPWLKAEKKPDFKIEGEIFDAYSPSQNKSVLNIRSEVAEKIQERQTRRIVLNMDDSRVNLNDLKKLLLEKPIIELQQVLVVKDGKVTKFFPFNGDK